MILIFSASIAFLIFLLILILVTYIRRTRDTDIFSRIRRHTSSGVKLQKKSKENFLQSVYGIIRQAAKPFVNKNFFSPLDLKLKQAGVPVVGAEYVIINLIGAALIALVVYLLTMERLAAIVIGLFFPIGLWMAILSLIRKRKNSFSEQLGDCLITFANALRAGYSFQQAMEVIAKEMESPIAQEFARTSNDIRMGVTVEDALEQMDRRVANSDFTLVVTAVLVQREVGGNLAQILDTISDTIAERIRMKREINALTAQGRLSAIILVALPFVMGVFMYLFSRSQIMILLEEPTGQIAVAASIVMDIIGFVVIRRIVDIDV